MPCSDVTEVLRLILDPKERVVNYALNKRTCGGGVGDPSLIAYWVNGRLCSEILETSPHDFLRMNPTQDTIQEFLRLKHFFAVQGGLKSFIGLESGGPHDSCALDKVAYKSDGTTELTIEVKVKVITEKIQGCGSCGSCGTKNPALALKLRASSLL